MIKCNNDLSSENNLIGNGTFFSFIINELALEKNGSNTFATHI